MTPCSSPFAWFSDEDQEILGDRICSKCYQEIPELPILLFAESDRDKKTYIARFHSACFNELVDSGVIGIGKS